MTQIAFKIESGFQNKMIELLNRKDIHAEGMFGFARTSQGIEPLIFVSSEIPNLEKFQKELYDLVDRYFDFHKILELSKESNK